VPDVEALADRLRIAVQGCTLHIHGPVQAWHAIHEQDADHEVLTIIRKKSLDKVAGLREAGVTDDDPRIRKELLTERFCTALLDW
jgi:hypothetical protein